MNLWQSRGIPYPEAKSAQKTALNPSLPLKIFKKKLGKFKLIVQLFQHFDQ